MWITFAPRTSIFAVRTDFDQIRGRLNTLSTGRVVENREKPEFCQGCTILPRTAIRHNSAAPIVVFLTVFSGTADFAILTIHGQKADDFGGVIPIKNPSRGRPRRTCRNADGNRGWEGRANLPYGSVKVSSSTSVWVLFFMSRRLARPVASSLSPRIRV